MGSAGSSVGLLFRRHDSQSNYNYNYIVYLQHELKMIKLIVIEDMDVVARYVVA